MVYLSIIYRGLATTLLVLGIIVFIVYFYTLTIYGYYTIEIYVENTTIRTITIKLPRDEYGEPVYRVTEFTATLYTNKGSRDIEPTIISYNKGFLETIGLQVDLGEGKHNITGRFTLETLHVYDYSNYPWTVYGDSEVINIYPNIRKSITHNLIASIKEFGLPLIYALSILLIGLASYSIYQLGRGIFYQQKPVGPITPAGAKKECKWCNLCIRFFKIDISRKNNSQLPKPFIEKLLRILNKVNNIWRECCITFYPCIDSRNKIVARAINPNKIVEVIVESGYAIYQNMQIRYEVVWKIDASKIFEDKSCKSIKISNGKVKVKYREYVRAVWATTGNYNGRRYGEGERVEPNVLRLFLDDVAKAIKEKKGDPGKIERLAKSVWGRELTSNVDVQSVLKALIRENNYYENCIDIVIVDKIDETTTEHVEEGYASKPGRIVIISSSVFDHEKENVLAHELGHNLSLSHIHENDNLMEAVISGSKLNKEQCRAAHSNCMDNKYIERKFSSKICDKGDKIFSSFKKKQSLIEKKQLLERKINNLREKLNNVDKKSRECKEKLSKIKNEYDYAKFIYNRVKPLANKIKNLRNKNNKKEIERIKKKIKRNLEKRKEREKKYLKKPRLYKSAIINTRKWIQVYKKRLEAVENPDSVLNKLKTMVDSKKREYIECRKYAYSPNSVKNMLRREIGNKEKALKDLVNRIEDLEKILRTSY